MESYKGLEIFIQVVSFLGAILIFFKGYEEYRKSNRTKRAEFLETLIKEFDSKKMINAKRILDDFIVPEYTKKRVEKWNGVENFPCKKMVRTLRDHTLEGNKIEDDDEILIRDSFDHLLTFFTKISYYYKNELITNDELYYFEYYLKKLEHPKYREGVYIYIKTYYNIFDFERLGLNFNKSQTEFVK